MKGITFINLISDHVRFLTSSQTTVDSISMEEMDKIAREDHSMVISCELGLNLEGPGGLKDRIWVS